MDKRPDLAFSSSIFLANCFLNASFSSLAFWASASAASVFALSSATAAAFDWARDVVVVD